MRNDDKSQRIRIAKNLLESISKCNSFRHNKGLHFPLWMEVKENVLDLLGIPKQGNLSDDGEPFDRTPYFEEIDKCILPGNWLTSKWIPLLKSIQQDLGFIEVEGFKNPLEVEE